jgi:hypothetical protein
MKLRILRDVMVAGARKDAGSIIELEGADAHLLLGMGKAEVAKEEEPAKPAPAPKATKAKPESPATEA